MNFMLFTCSVISKNRSVTTESFNKRALIVNAKLVPNCMHGITNSGSQKEAGVFFKVRLN